MHAQHSRAFDRAASPNDHAPDRRWLAFLVSTVLADWHPCADGVELINTHDDATHRALTAGTVRRILADAGCPPSWSETRAVISALWAIPDQVAEHAAAPIAGCPELDYEARQWLAMDKIYDGWRLACGLSGDEKVAIMPGSTR